jgi:hypothetical protein
MIGEERIPGKFSCEGCRRPSVGSESLLVAKNSGPLYGKPPLGYDMRGGGRGHR